MIDSDGTTKGILRWPRRLIGGVAAGVGVTRGRNRGAVWHRTYARVEKPDPTGFRMLSLSRQSLYTVKRGLGGGGGGGFGAGGGGGGHVDPPVAQVFGRWPTLHAIGPLRDCVRDEGLRDFDLPNLWSPNKTRNCPEVENTHELNALTKCTIS